MRVEINFFGISVDVKKSDTELPLFVRKFARDNRVLFGSSRDFLDIKIKELATAIQSNDVYRRLLRVWSENITSLRHQPLGGKELSPFTITYLLIYSHSFMDSPIAHI